MQVLFRSDADGCSSMRRKQDGYFQWAIPILLLAGFFFHAAACFAGDAEPLFYIYHGQHNELRLDPDHVAVRLRSNAVDQLPPGLTARGFSAADIEARPLGDWVVLRAHSLAQARTNAQPAVSNSPQTQSVAVHNLVRSLGATGDP